MILQAISGTCFHLSKISEICFHLSEITISLRLGNISPGFLKTCFHLSKISETCFHLSLRLYFSKILNTPNDMTCINYDLISFSTHYRHIENKLNFIFQNKNMSLNDLDDSGINYTETDLCPTITTTTEEPFGNSDWECAYLNSDSNFYRSFLIRLTQYFFSYIPKLKSCLAGT